MTKPLFRLTALARLAGAALLVAPGAAWAHPGHDGAPGFASGFAHPFTGIDHLGAMLLVGLWTGLLLRQSRAMWALPAAFLAAMLAGFGLAGTIGGGAAEPLIVLSLLALGGAVALRARAPLPFALAAVMLFGFAHGQAHGLETPAGAFPALFAAGFLVATGVLQGAGLWCARVLPAPVLRAIGAAGAGLGLVLAGAA